MADKKPAKAKKPTGVPFNIRIDPALKKRLGHWCLDHDKEMTEVVVALLADFLNHQPKPLPRPR